MSKVTKKFQKNAERKLDIPTAPAMPCKRYLNGITKVVAKSGIAFQKSPKQYMAEKWNLMNPQDNDWNFLKLRIMKIALRAKVSLR